MAGHYVCDFSNVIVGGPSVKKFFWITNVGKMQVNFKFDKKLTQDKGLTI